MRSTALSSAGLRLCSIGRSDTKDTKRSKADMLAGTRDARVTEEQNSDLDISTDYGRLKGGSLRTETR